MRTNNTHKNINETINLKKKYIKNYSSYFSSHKNSIKAKNASYHRPSVMRIQIPYLCKEALSVQISGDWRKFTKIWDPKGGVMFSVEIFKTDYFLVNSQN